MIAAFMEARWLTEILSDSKDLVIGQGRRCINISHARPNREVVVI